MNNLSKKLLVLSMAGAMTLSGSVLSFADTTSTSPEIDELQVTMRKEAPDNRGEGRNGDRHGQGLLTSEFLTGDEAETIEAYLSDNANKRPDLLTELVNEGILTEERAEELRAEMQAEREADREERQAEREAERVERQDTMISNWLENDLIDESTAKEIGAFLDERHEERIADREVLDDMDPEERKDYLEANRPEKGNCLEDLVNEGILTDDEAAAIQELMPERPEGGERPERGERPQRGEKPGFGQEKQ